MGTKKRLNFDECTRNGQEGEPERYPQVGEVADCVPRIFPNSRHLPVGKETKQELFHLSCEVEKDKKHLGREKKAPDWNYDI